MIRNRAAPGRDMELAARIQIPRDRGGFAEAAPARYHGTETVLGHRQRVQGLDATSDQNVDQRADGDLLRRGRDQDHHGRVQRSPSESLRFVRGPVRVEIDHHQDGLLGIRHIGLSHPHLQVVRPIPSMSGRIEDGGREDDFVEELRQPHQHTFVITRNPTGPPRNRLGTKRS